MYHLVHLNVRDKNTLPTRDSKLNPNVWDSTVLQGTAGSQVQYITLLYYNTYFLVARAGPSPRDGQIPNGKYVYTGAQELYIVTCTVIMIEVGVNALTKSALRGIKNGQIISVVDKEPPNSKGNSKLYEVSSHNKIIL